VELTQRGHEITLSDISESELEQAKLHARDCNIKIAHVVQSDARDIRLNAELYKKEHFHVVLCQGPFYHLLDQQERYDLLATLAEVTIPGGFILAAFVTMFAHLRDIATKDPGRLLLKKPFYTEYLKTGNYTANPATGMHHFHVEEIRDLFHRVSSASRLSLERLVACEGFLGGRLSASLSGLDDHEFQEWLHVILQFAEDPSALGTADHLLAVARKL
jgi:S-adenosylmethionine-dependent methyltransferase